MNNLENLVAAKNNRQEFILEAEDGSYSKFEEGATGTLRTIDSRILFEVFGEFPLSADKLEVFKVLRKIKVDKPAQKKRKTADKADK